MEWANLLVLIINTILTGVLGVAGLLIAKAAADIHEELEEWNEDEDESG